GRAEQAEWTDPQAVRDHRRTAGGRRPHRRGSEDPGRRNLSRGRSGRRGGARGDHGLDGHARGAIRPPRTALATRAAKEAVTPRVLRLALAVLAAPSLMAAQQPATVRINYVNADLGDVIRSLAAVLGVNVVLTDVPSRRITFQTPQPVPAPQAGAVLEAILESQSLVIVQSGPVAQVMPEEKRPSTGPVRVGKEFPTPPPLGLVTQIVPLDYIRAEEGVTLLKQVASKTARVEVVPRSNSVLITDRGVHIARYLDLLRQLDIKTGGEAGLRTYVYPLKHARAAELLRPPRDHRATRRPSPASPPGSADRRGHPRPGQPVRDQLAAVHAAGRPGRLDARDRRRSRPAKLRRHVAEGLPGPRRAGRQPRQFERAGDPGGARVAHQRARAVYAARAGAEQRGGAHPGGKRGAVRVLHVQRPDGGAEHRGPVPQRGHAANRHPDREQRWVRHVPRAAGGERAVHDDDRGSAERPGHHYARGG